MAALPTELRTPHLALQTWNSTHAEALHPILRDNVEHLGPWIPARIASPAPVPVLAERLDGFAADFAADREWRFAMIEHDRLELVGEVDLFPRSVAGRVHLDEADRAEIGYWVRADRAGRGYATEAVQALLRAGRGIPRFSHFEIRCDSRNAPSAAIPARLGFHLASASPASSGSQLQVWTLEASEIG